MNEPHEYQCLTFMGFYLVQIVIRALAPVHTKPCISTIDNNLQPTAVFTQMRIKQFFCRLFTNTQEPVRVWNEASKRLRNFMAD
jgi:hypothetical protein